MTITARVQDHSVRLPADVEIPEGTEVQVILPEGVTTSPAEGPLAWMEEFEGCLDSLPPDAAEMHNVRAHGRKRSLP